MQESMLSRTISLIGEDNFAKFAKLNILIVGLGGVGGTAFECLLRSGFKSFILVDFDKVNLSNLNRQILYTASDVDSSKVDVAKKHALQIDSSFNIKTINKKFDPDIIFELSKEKIDYIVDAIDDIQAKVNIIKYALDKKIKIIVSLGMANRLDPTKVIITTLDKTYACPLAKKLRGELRKENVDLRKIFCVFSSEEPLVKQVKPSSMMMVPSSAGLSIAYYIINDVLKGE